MNGKPLFQIAFILLFISGIANAQPLGGVCLNSTAANYTDGTNYAVQHCAWGCQGGECIDGVALAMNGLFVLAVCWGIALVMIWISNQLSSEEDMSKTVLKLLGLLMMVIGILAALGVYNEAPHIGAIVRNLLTGIATSFPEALVLLALFVVIVKVVNMGWKEWVDRGATGL